MSDSRYGAPRALSYPNAGITEIVFDETFKVTYNPVIFFRTRAGFIDTGVGLDDLSELNISGNELTSIPELVGRVVDILDCSRNRLSAIPRLPFVQKLDCSHNQLTTLPEIPLLTQLKCQGNNLTHAHYWHPYLRRVKCDHKHARLIRGPIGLYDFSK